MLPVVPVLPEPRVVGVIQVIPDLKVTTANLVRPATPVVRVRLVPLEIQDELVIPVGRDPRVLREPEVWLEPTVKRVIREPREPQDTRVKWVRPELPVIPDLRVILVIPVLRVN